MNTQSERDRRAYAQGVALTIAVACLFSLTGVVLRFVDDADPWQVIFYRSIALSVAVGVFLVGRHGARAPSRLLLMGWPGLIAGVCLGLDNVLYLLAIAYTTIANVVFLICTAPFFTAILALALLRERVTRRTWLGIGVAVVGAGIMVVEGFAVGGWLGNMLALLATLAYAGFAVALRWGRAVDMWPSVLVAGVVAVAISATVVGGFAISWRDLALCAVQGALIGGLGNVLLAWCARHVPAAELTFLGLAESILAPLWVWLAFAETPTVATMVGGAVILAAVLATTLAAARGGAGSRPPAVPS